jgi:hypothetical protein
MSSTKEYKAFEDCLLDLIDSRLQGVVSDLAKMINKPDLDKSRLALAGMVFLQVAFQTQLARSLAAMPDLPARARAALFRSAATVFGSLLKKYQESLFILSFVESTRALKDHQDLSRRDVYSILRLLSCSEQEAVNLIPQICFFLDRIVYDFQADKRLEVLPVFLLPGEKVQPCLDFGAEEVEQAKEKSTRKKVTAPKDSLRKRQEG